MTNKKTFAYAHRLLHLWESGYDVSRDPRDFEYLGEAACIAQQLLAEKWGLA